MAKGTLLTKLTRLKRSGRGELSPSFALTMGCGRAVRAWRVGRASHQDDRHWQARRYRVSLFFLSLPNIETALARVASRVRQGGHGIPDAVIRRRFVSGRENFHRHYKMVVNDWALYDNTGAVPVLLEWGENQ